MRSDRARRGLKLLFVAERFNQPRSSHWERYVYDRAQRDYHHWLRLSAHVGAFLLGDGRERLKSAGLEVTEDDVSLNMLPPSQQHEPWDAAKARDVAQHMTFEWSRRAEFDGWVLVGRRVACAFGMGRQPLGSYVPACATFVVAHPSGLSRWWNEPANVEVCRSEVQDWFFLLECVKKDKERKEARGD